VPYSVLVAALGAIVATAFAMFGLHSWSAMKIAPVIGAIIGLIVAAASLRRYGLSFGATLDEYRSAAGVRSLKDISLLYMNIALGAGIVVSLVELPFVLVGQATALYVCMAGWAVIVGFMLYRAWQISDPASFGNLDVFQIVGGTALLISLGAMLYAIAAGLKAGIPAQSVPAFGLVRIIFLLNLMAAIEAMVIVTFGLHVLYRILGKISPQ
jgi:hypothetical protein